MKTTLGRFELEYPDSLVVQHYSCKDYRGIQFVYESVKYDVLDNIHMGERIIISEGEGCFRDMPFHLGTASFLPACVKTVKLGE